MREKFRVVPNGVISDKEMIEYWRDGKFIAGIYTHEDGIRIVSKYMTGVSMEAPPAAGTRLPPAAIVELEV